MARLMIFVTFKNNTRQNALSDIEINETTLKECLCYMAYMVNEHGDTYLPIFERLKEELEILKQREALKNYARKIANENIKL